MRKTFFLFACAAAMVGAQAGLARADESQDHQNHAATQAQDSNYRFHNGRWWYWMAGQQNWKVWDGGQWVDYQPGITRSFSYDPSAAQATGGYVPSSGNSNLDYNGMNDPRIMGSFGFRGAGSKIRGNY